MQVEGLFDIPPTERSEVVLRASLPIEDKPWSIGLIVGPSGSGKTSIAREVFGDAFTVSYSWPENKSVVDGFPSSMGTKAVVGLLSSVGFSSPPSWLRPFRCLSTGEQFRATVARALAEQPDLTVLDEFTSVVDRTVARVSSAAVAKAVRANKRRLVAVSCHYDIIEWLSPDWILDTVDRSFQWRELQRRPPVQLEIRRVSTDAWDIFGHHHYLTTTLHRNTICFLATVEDRPAAFTGVLAFPHADRPGWREHRTVCLPDFQGIGIGNALSEYVASLFRASRKPYRSTTSHPAMIAHRARSPLWSMVRTPSLQNSNRRPRAGMTAVVRHWRQGGVKRLTATFEYVGPARRDDATGFLSDVRSLRRSLASG
jgi:ABC-type transport system involved in cytochrome c biogenesis ATPase subunit